MPPEIEDTPELELQTPVQDDAEVAASATAEPSADAGSSTATDVSNTAEPDTLSIVRDVVEKRQEGDAAASSATGEDGSPSADTQPAAGAEDYSDVPFNKHPRFQEVLAKAKANETDAERYRNVQGFLDREGLSGEDAANGLALLAQTRNAGLSGGEMADSLHKLALCKMDPVAGWAAIRPWVQQLLFAAGEVLPADLQQRVQTGEISQDIAVEQSRLRAQVETQRAQQTFVQQRALADQQTGQQRALTGAASEWEADRQRKDPNFATKLPAIVDEVRKLQSMGWKPTTPDGVKEQLRRAYAAVNGGTRTAPATPAVAPRRQIQPITGGQVAGNTAPAPQSTLDHVRAVLSKRRSG